MANGATPLGYGAAVLPQSTFDPNKFGQQVAALESKKKDTAKAAAKKAKDKALESMNPELGKLKWTAPYLGEYQDKIKDFRKRNIQNYSQQNGRLTEPQIAENAIFKENTKAEFDLLNEGYTRLTQAQAKVNSDPRYDTPENRALLERYSNPYKNDAAALKKAGGILEYIATEPLTLKPKKADLDINKILSGIKTGAGTTTTVEDPVVDPVTGQFKVRSKQQQNLAGALSRANQVYDTDQAIQEQYPDKNDFLQLVSLDNQNVKETDKFIKPEKDGKGLNINVGGFSSTGDIKISKLDRKGLETDVTRNVASSFADTTIGGELSPEAKKVAKEYIASNSYAVSDDKGKPISISGFVDSVGLLTENGIENPDGISGNIQIDVSNIEEIPTLSQDIDLNNFKRKSMDLDLLRQRAVNGKLPTGLLLTDKEIKALNKLNLSDAFANETYAVGRIKNIKELLDVGGSKKQIKDGKKGKPIRFENTLTDAAFVRYDQLSAQFENRGLKYEPENQSKTFISDSEESKLIGSGQYEYVKNRQGERFIRNKKTKETQRIK